MSEFENSELTPAWFAKKKLDEVIFCCEFLQYHPMVCVGGSFYTKDGKVSDEEGIRRKIYEELSIAIKHGLARKSSKAFFEEALVFMKKHQSEETIISAVVHMDEKTPHMHLSFVPLTADKRLCAKEIVGNKKKLTEWQDAYWKHMVKKYPALERGESASKTGRTHIPLRLYKEAVHLNHMKEQIMTLMAETNPFNKKAKEEEMYTLLDQYVPGVEAMRTKLKKYDARYKELLEENKKLDLKSRHSIKERMGELGELEELRRIVNAIPQEIREAYENNLARPSKKLDRAHE